MITKLPFGRDSIPVDLRGLRVRALRPTAPPGASDPGRLAGTACDRPLAGPPLAELARGRRSATIIVPDATRRVAVAEVLPAVLSRLGLAGLAPSSISVLVACGTHPPVPSAELRDLLGSLPDGVAAVQHDARERQHLVAVGTTPAGVPVRLHRLAAAADLLLTIGGVRHHYFAGFGGGPKMVFPGVAGYDEIQANHARVLRELGGTAEREPACEAGRLEGNPVAEEIAAAADLRSPDLCLCLVPGSDGRPAFAAAGPWRQAFATATDRAREWYEVPDSGPFGLAVASAGGFPSDWSLIQAHKGLDAVCRFLAPGGELLFVADMAGGAGSRDMEPFLADPHPAAILDRLRQGWVQYGHTTLRIVDKTARYRIHLVSQLDHGLSRRLGFLPVQDAAAVVDGWRRSHDGESVAVMPGQAVYPRVAPTA